MIPVWLYSADGRQLYFTFVILPMPQVVTRFGHTFCWSALNQRYQECIPWDTGGEPDAPTGTEANTTAAPQPF